MQENSPLTDTLFADIIVPVPIPQLFTYRVPVAWMDGIAIGQRVVVQFGSRKVVTGIVRHLHHQPPQKYEAKYLLDILDEKPYILPIHLEFWEWMASYYLCTIGEVMNAALPSGLKISSQSRIQLNPSFDWEEEGQEWSDKETLLLNALKSQEALTYPEASEVLQVKNIYETLKFLLAKKAIILYEEVKEKYQPKRVRRVRLAGQYAVSERHLEALFEQLSSKAKQEAILLKYLSQVPIYASPALNDKGLEKSLLMSEDGGEVSASSLKTLVKNGVFEEFEVIVSRLDAYEDAGALFKIPEISLSDDQQKAYDAILGSFDQHQTTLLHGITGSGKTEIYIELIQQVIDNGSQVLLMLPEIALTTQIVLRLKKAFGTRIGIYHSKFSDNERVEVWKGVASGRYPFVVGVRSSLFLPFDNLGLVIIDEEHEPSYKQYDPAPRYHARDAAMMLAYRHQAKVLLGSATPAVETYYMAQTGKYGFVELLRRFGVAQLPAIQLVDTALEKKQRKMRENFSSVLLEAIQERVAKGEQAILFQNRRGYAPYITCEDCSWTPECQNCSVSLTYHLYRNDLRCHYCGHQEHSPRVCVACGSTKLKTMGLGTERIEDELKILLPTIRVQRMDADTTRKKYSYQQIIQDFERGGIDVLVGTQMVSKGLDFDKVSLVGVFEVDRLLHFPDFRANERTFQLVTQVSGRAGRREQAGLVIIQTANPRQTLLQQVVTSDYRQMYQQEIQERQQYAYPPFTRLIRLTVRCQDLPLRDEAALVFAAKLRQQLGEFRVLGPEKPVIDKVRNYYLSDILIKLERGKVNLTQAKDRIREAITALVTTKEFKKVEVVADVDCL